MPSVDKLCSAFCADLSRSGDIKPEQLPVNENLLVMFLEDPVIAALAQKTNPRDLVELAAQNQKFNLAVIELTQKKFGIKFEPTPETMQGLFYYCLGVQRALDEISDLPNWNEDQLGVIRKYFQMDSRVNQTCSELFKEAMSADDALPLLICALRLLKKNNEPLFNRVHAETTVILQQLQKLTLAAPLTPVMDYKYTGDDVIGLLERRLTDFFCAFMKIISNTQPATWNIGKINDFIESVYDFMVETEIALRERDILAAKQEFQGLKKLILEKNANLDDKAVKDAMKEVILSNPFLGYRILADESLKLTQDFKSRVSGELENNVDPEKLNGPENAHVRTARKILLALVNAIGSGKADFNTACWKSILESFLCDREVAHYLQLELKKIKNPPLEVSEIFGKVNLYHRIIPMLNKIFLDEKITPAKQLDEIRLMLVKNNVTEKRKIEYLIKVAIYENSGLTTAVSYYIPANWKSRPSTLALLSVVDINNFEHLNQLYNQLTERAHFVEAETRLEKQGVFGQLEAVKTLIAQSEFEVIKKINVMVLENLNNKIHEITTTLTQLAQAEHELEHAKYFSKTVVEEPMQRVVVYKEKLNELLHDAIIMKLCVLFSAFEQKHSQLEHGECFHEELVRLRSIYLEHQPKIEKLPVLHRAKYAEIINNLAAQFETFTELEEFVAQPAGPAL